MEKPPPAGHTAPMGSHSHASKRRKSDSGVDRRYTYDADANGRRDHGRKNAQLNHEGEPGGNHAGPAVGGCRSDGRKWSEERGSARDFDPRDRGERSDRDRDRGRDGRRRRDYGMERGLEQERARARKPDFSEYHDDDGHYIIRLGEGIGEVTKRNAAKRRFKMLSHLGEGTFGKVVEVFDRDLRVHRAAKIIKAVPKYRQAAEIELRVLKKLQERDRHGENLCVKLVDWFDFRDHICMIFDKLGISIFDHMTRNSYSPFSVHEVKHFAAQALKALCFIHECDLTHTDLKPENILLNRSAAVLSDGEFYLQHTDITIIDFGSATFHDEHHTKIVSTRHYRAPEVILEMGWGSQCDIWSLGCILVELVTGKVMFQTHDNMEHLAIMEKTLGKLPPRFVRLSGRRKFFTDDDRLNWPKMARDDESERHVEKIVSFEELLVEHCRSLDASFIVLVRDLLWYDPVGRPTAAKASELEFVAGFDKAEHAKWLASRWSKVTAAPGAKIVDE